MHYGMNGLAEEPLLITPAGGSTQTGTRTEINMANQPCPCDCEEQLVDETWYLTDTPTADGIPIPIQEKTVECDSPPESAGEYDPKCEDIVAALRQMGFTNIQGLSACNLRGLGNTTGADSGTASGGNTPSPSSPADFLKTQKAGLPIWAWALIGGAGLYMLAK